MKSIENIRTRIQLVLYSIFLLNFMIITGQSGSEGILSFGIAYEIYMIFYALSIQNLPSVIFRFTQKRIQKGKVADAISIQKRAVLLSIAYMLIISGVFYVIGYFILYGLLADTFAYAILLIFIPTYLCQCIVQLFCGYFETKGSMLYSVMIGVVQAITVLFSSLLICSKSRAYGAKVGTLLLHEADYSRYGGLGFSLSMLLAGLFSVLLCIILYFVLDKNQDAPATTDRSEEPALLVCSSMFYTGLAHSKSDVLFHCTFLIAFIIPQLFLAKHMAFINRWPVQYGLVIPFVFIISNVIHFISMLQIQGISYKLRKQEVKQARFHFKTWNHLLAVIGSFVTIFLFALSKSFCGILETKYMTDFTVEFQIASLLFFTYGFAFCYLRLLNTLNKKRQSAIVIWSGFITFVAVFMICLFVLKTTVFAFLLAFILSNLVSSIVAGVFLSNLLKVQIRIYNHIILPTLYALVGGFIVAQFEKLFSHMLGNVITILLCFLIYFVIDCFLLSFTKNIEHDEIPYFPLGKFLYDFAKKIHLIS